MPTKIALIASAFVLVLLVPTCGDDGAPGTSEDPRTIEITALDELAYEPASIEVEPGETVHFVVTNDGEADHEFVVGDIEMQEMAEQQAMEGMHGHAEAMASVALDPGETAETTVTFDEPDELFYACHLPGHYEGGMVGTIVVR